MSSRKQQTDTDPPLTGLLVMLGVCLVVVLAGLGVIYLVAGSSGSGGPEVAAPNTTGDDTGQTGSNQNGSVLPDFVMTASEDVRMAYRYAMDRPDVMIWMPCYCGCGDHAGHKSAKNCFIKEGSTAGDVQFDDHGANCAMCVSIALDTKAMLEQGRSLREIRDYIDEEYGSIGPGTDTPLPPA